MKKGTDNDKQHLPVATYLNRPRAAGLKRRRGAAVNRPQQQPERQRRRGPHTAIVELEAEQVAHAANNNSSDDDLQI